MFEHSCNTTKIADEVDWKIHEESYILSLSFEVVSILCMREAGVCKTQVHTHTWIFIGIK